MLSGFYEAAIIVERIFILIEGSILFING